MSVQLQLAQTWADAVLTTDRQRVQALSVGLEISLEQLEGWIAWKCPARHKAEHERLVAALRALLKNHGTTAR